MNSTSAVIGALVLSLVVGGLIAAQPPINAELARRSSDLAAALFSVAISFFALAAVFLFLGDFGSLWKVRDAPPVYWTGGLLGALFVGVSLVTVRVLGAGALTAALISAQLIVAAVLDQLGAFGLDRVSFSGVRVVAVAALILGTVLMTVRL
jgi:transporter family-2 protein